MGLIETSTRGAIFCVSITRPGRRNAIDQATAEALHDAFTAFDADDALSVAVLSGSEGAFCAGADLKEVAGGGGNRVSDDMIEPGPLGVTRLRLGKPVIAAVEGHAVAGGLELALWCDMRVAAEDAVFGVYCRRWGVPLVDGGTVRLPRLIGHAHALDLILTGRGVSGDEARAMGLASRVVPSGQAFDAALALAEQIAAFPQLCMRQRSAVELRAVGPRLRRSDAQRVRPRHRGAEVRRDAGRRAAFRLGRRPSRQLRRLSGIGVPPSRPKLADAERLTEPSAGAAPSRPARRRCAMRRRARGRCRRCDRAAVAARAARAGGRVRARARAGCRSARASRPRCRRGRSAG